MQHYNVLVGCDQKYYNDWAENLILSIRHFNPWLTCHVHIVNPKKYKKIDGVKYTTERRNFPNESVRIGYLQSVRFLKVAENFKDQDFVMTLDADTICTRETTPDKFLQIANRITMLRHLKDYHWLAGLVTFGDKRFRQELSNKLLEKPIEEWAPFHDQIVLDELSKKYVYYEQHPKHYWMSIGKNGHRSVFLTLKGAQKTKEKYLNIYNETAKQIR